MSFLVDLLSNGDDEHNPNFGIIPFCLEIHCERTRAHTHTPHTHTACATKQKFVPILKAYDLIMSKCDKYSWLISYESIRWQRFQCKKKN